MAMRRTTSPRCSDCARGGVLLFGAWGKVGGVRLENRAVLDPKDNFHTVNGVKGPRKKRTDL